MERLLDQGHRFATLSVDQLAQEAGIARGTFYLHFKDKGELVARLMEHITEELIDSIGTWFSHADVAQPKDLMNALSGGLRTFKKHQAILQAVADMAPHDPTVAAHYDTLLERIGALTRDSLSTIRGKGLSRPGATANVALTLSNLIVTYCVHEISRYDGAALDRLAKSLGYIAVSTAFADQE